MTKFSRALLASLALAVFPLASVAPPDGHTLLLGTNGPLVINVSLYKSLPFDPLKDFEPITQVAQIPLVLLVLGRQPELFPLSDFDMPRAQGRSHPLLVEAEDGYGLYLTINMPGKTAAPHDHGIWWMPRLSPASTIRTPAPAEIAALAGVV